MKFLAILLIFFLLLLIGLNFLKIYIRKKINSAFKSMNQNFSKSNVQKNEQVLYEKDDIIVLQGESKKEKSK